MSRSNSGFRRAVCRYGDVQRHMAFGVAETKESFVDGREDRAGIATQLGAEILGAVEGAGALQEVDAAVDLVHMGACSHDVERELGGAGLACFDRAFDRSKCCVDARWQRFRLAGRWID